MRLSTGVIGSELASWKLRVAHSPLLLVQVEAILLSFFCMPRAPADQLDMGRWMVKDALAGPSSPLLQGSLVQIQALEAADPSLTPASALTV